MGHPVNDVSNISPPPSLIHIWDRSTSTVDLSTPSGAVQFCEMLGILDPLASTVSVLCTGCRFRDEISSISQGMPEENLEKLSRSRDLEIMGEERTYPIVSTSSMIKFCTVHSLLSLIIKEIKSKITSRLSRARPNCKLLRFWQPQIAVRFHKPYRPAVYPYLPIWQSYPIPRYSPFTSQFHPPTTPPSHIRGWQFASKSFTLAIIGFNRHSRTSDTDCFDS